MSAISKTIKVLSGGGLRGIRIAKNTRIVHVIDTLRMVGSEAE